VSDSAAPAPAADFADPALVELRRLLLDPGMLLAIAAGRSRSGVPSWRRVEVRPVDLRAGRRLQIVRFDQSQAFTANLDYGPVAHAAVDDLLAEPFGSWLVRTEEATVQVRRTRKGRLMLHRDATGAGAAAEDAAAPAAVARAGGRRPHDRVKRRMLDPASPFLRELGITDLNGKVKPSRQAKYRQVEEFVRVLDSVVEELVPPGESAQGSSDVPPLLAVDLGCGNAYLTFAAYEFLSAEPRLRGRSVHLVGVDVKAQAVDHGRKVAEALGWTGSVQFVSGTVTDAGLPCAETADALVPSGQPPDLVLALHACDTATDEALARGVRGRARVVLAAPCCHHDIQRQLAAGKRAPVEFRALMRQPILRERFADVLTDALRAGLLRLLGYRVEIVEFVGSEHTPRNTLIRAVRTGARPTPDRVEEYVRMSAAWGVVPHLQTLLAPELAGILATARTV
jgi:SAM-dependent methyltransferase